MNEFDCLQVSVAFNVVFDSGLNEYALYLDCEGDRTYHKGYEMTMSHLFKAYRKNAHSYKVRLYFHLLKCCCFLFFVFFLEL